MIVERPFFSLVRQVLLSRSTMGITFRCAGCSRSYQTDARNIGRTVTCKSCGRQIRIEADAGEDVYGFNEPVAQSAPLPRMPNPPRTSGPMAMGSKPGTKAKAKSKDSNFKFMGLSGAGGVILAVVLVTLKIVGTANRMNRNAAANGPPAPPPNLTAADMAGGTVNPLRAQGQAGGTSASWSMPNLPPLGAWTEIEPGVSFQEVRFAMPPGQNTPPGHSGKLWLYMPSGADPASKLPCVFITGAGSKLFTGMDLGDGDRPEHLPYARAGFVVVAFEMDGFPPKNENAPDSEYSEPARAFFRAQAGLVNARVAIAFASSRLAMADPEHFYIAGHSSAATAALVVAAYEPAIKACAAFAPAVDMESRFPTLVRALVTRIAPGSADLFTRYNPRKIEGQINCPVMLFYARDDTVVSTSDIQQMANSMKGMGKRVELVTAPGGGHYESMINEGIPNAISWFQSIGGGSSAGPWVPIQQPQGMVAAGPGAGPNPGFNQQQGMQPPMGGQMPRPGMPRMPQIPRPGMPRMPQMPRPGMPRMPQMPRPGMPRMPGAGRLGPNNNMGGFSRPNPGNGFQGPGVNQPGG